MKNYSSINVVTGSEINEYIQKGWEIIDTSRYSYDGGANNVELQYHIGYPLQRKYEELLSLVKLFEEHGFKEKLFEKIAESEGVNLQEFSTKRGYTLDQTYEVVQFMVKYESIVNGKDNITFYRNSPSDLEDDESEF